MAKVKEGRLAKIIRLRDFIEEELQDDELEQLIKKALYDADVLRDTDMENLHDARDLLNKMIYQETVDGEDGNDIKRS